MLGIKYVLSLNICTVNVFLKSKTEHGFISLNGVNTDPYLRLDLDLCKHTHQTKNGRGPCHTLQSVLYHCIRYTLQSLQ